MTLPFQKRKRRLPKQLELGVTRAREPDRNYEKGGRSFYFFDFDDNIAFLSTPIWIFHKKSGEPMKLGSGEYANFRNSIGKYGKYEEYELVFGPEGSFKSFRDKKLKLYHRFLGQRQDFENDIEQALSFPDFDWKGPSWNCFYHAVFNKRPISLITARGHKPSTIQKGITQFVDRGFLPNEPNYLSVFPVSNERTQIDLVGKFDESNEVARLKQLAIRKSVEDAINTYGENPYHRFGMSDDDPKNLELIVEEMKSLKKDLPLNSFFVISTHGGTMVKKEIFSDHTIDSCITERNEQLSLI